MPKNLYENDAVPSIWLRDDPAPVDRRLLDRPAVDASAAAPFASNTPDAPVPMPPAMAAMARWLE